MFSENEIKNALLQGKILSKKEIDEIFENVKKQKKPLEDFLIEENIVSEEILYEAIADYLKIPFADIKNQIINPETLFLIPEPIAVTHEVVAIKKNEREKEIVLATLDPKDIQIFEFIERKTGLSAKVYLTAPSFFQEVLKQYHRGLETKFKEITEEGAKEEKNGKDLKELAKDLPIIRIVDSILEYAVFENASDIHIEPLEKEVLVRYRIDGILRDVMTLPRASLLGIIARIKVVSNLKIDEHRLPQDGRFKIETKEYKVSFRVSTLPVFDGEKVALRLLWESGKILTLEQLGLQKRIFKLVEQNIEKPHGMILVTGPTGSGKTTTLYTILNILNKPGVNISTVEDPIEYQIPRVNQTQVNPQIGFKFATGLRSLLRQDPDIIMVGEIRDNETASMAVHSAMTGHLVLSTLHTNDAVTTLPRLQEMGVPSFLVASTTNMIIAQRLVRRVCSNCIKSVNLDEEQIEEFSKEFEVKEVLDTMVAEGIIASEQKSLKSLLFYKGVGCKQCANQGYKGRIGIYEALVMTDDLAKAITKGANAQELKEEAKKQKMLTMFEDGFIKAKSGITTIEEVLRVTRE